MSERNESPENNERLDPAEIRHLRNLVDSSEIRRTYAKLLRHGEMVRLLWKLNGQRLREVCKPPALIGRFGNEYPACRADYREGLFGGGT